MLRDCLSKLGYNPADHGLHSVRSGGITSAVHDSSNSIPERLLKMSESLVCCTVWRTTIFIEPFI